MIKTRKRLIKKWINGLNKNKFSFSYNQGYFDSYMDSKQKKNKFDKK